MINIYVCKMCGKVYFCSLLLKKHEMCHIKKQPVICKYRGQTFKNKKYCDMHQKNMHFTSSLSKEFKCKLCHKVFKTKEFCIRHYGMGYKCIICFKVFISKSHLIRHLNSVQLN